MNEVTNNIPGISNLTSLVEKQEVQGFLEGLIGEYGWLLLIAIATILAKDMIMNLVQGILVFMGNDFNNDDIIYISGRQARIVRVGIRNTVFYMSDRSSKMLVPNEQLKQLTIEKSLPKNGGAPYLPKGSDPGFVGVKEIPVEPHPMQVEVVTKPPSPKTTKK